MKLSPKRVPCRLKHSLHTEVKTFRIGASPSRSASTFITCCIEYICISRHRDTNTNQVAARLGASVVLTDQSKILPTLERNARSNARDLECRGLPASPVLCRGTTAAVSPPAADAADPPKNVAKTSSTETDDLATPASLASTAGSSPTLSGERCGCGTAAWAGSASRQQSDSSHAGEDGGTDVKGRWLATELLFSDSAEDLLRWRRSIFVGGRDTASGEAEEDEQGGAEADDNDLFDLVVAADVVYLNDLWDAMAFTMKVRANGCVCVSPTEITHANDGSKRTGWWYTVFFRPAGVFRKSKLEFWKTVVVLFETPRLTGESLADDPPPPSSTQALLKPKGEALMTFEQRRSNVDGFFGPPRFGEENDAWEHGEELNFEEGGAADGKGLGGAAKVARVRMFRMRRRGGGIDGLRS